MKLYRKFIRPMHGYPGQHYEPKTEPIEKEEKWYPEEEREYLEKKYASYNEGSFSDLIFEDKYEPYLLKEQDELLRKLQKDKDKLCLEVSEWKHKFHDRPLKDAVEPFHKCIGKDFILIEDSHFDYCPYCGKPITWTKQEGR